LIVAVLIYVKNGMKRAVACIEQVGVLVIVLFGR